MAAGFDKNGLLVDLLDHLGFGFMEVGSVTANPYSGNPKPRLRRLAESNSILVNYGLKNEGSEIIYQRLYHAQPNLPIGINVAMTNNLANQDTKKGIEDYLVTLQKFRNLASYFTLNISCPNSFGGQNFATAERLDALLEEVDSLSLEQPVLIKLSPDYELSEIQEVVKVMISHNIAGCVAGNLTKKRDAKIVKNYILPQEGGLSGKATAQLSNQLISSIYQQSKGRLTIIGCGGIFDADDVWEKIGLGATLTQLATGLIFGGPSIIGEINVKLSEKLLRSGFDNIQSAVGWAYRNPPF